MLKCRQPKGIYDSDPRENPQAHFFREISYLDVLQKGLKIMDSTAISLCMDNKLPIIVFDLQQQAGALSNVLAGKRVGTLVS